MKSVMNGFHSSPEIHTSVTELDLLRKTDVVKFREVIFLVYNEDHSTL